MDKADCVSTPLTAMVMVRRLVQEWLPLTTMFGSLTSELPLDQLKRSSKNKADASS